MARRVATGTLRRRQARCGGRAPPSVTWPGFLLRLLFVRGVFEEVDEEEEEEDEEEDDEDDEDEMDADEEDEEDEEDNASASASAVRTNTAAAWMSRFAEQHTFSKSFACENDRKLRVSPPGGAK